MAVEGEDAGESLASVGFFGPGDEFGRALGDDAAAALAAFRAEVDDPVGLFEDIADGVAFVADGERLGIVAAPAADLAHNINVRKKIHFDAAEAVALAGFAAAALHVEAEATGAVAALARFRQHGEEVADRPENAGVGGGIRARCAADGGLIDFDDFVDVFGADNLAVRGGRFRRAIELLRKRAIENVVDQRGFAGAGNTGDHSEKAERKRDVYLLQIVGARAEDLDGFAVGAAAFFGDGDLGLATEVLTGEGFRSGFDFSGFALGHEVAAGVAGAGAEVNHEIDRKSTRLNSSHSQIS